MAKNQFKSPSSSAPFHPFEPPIAKKSGRKVGLDELTGFNNLIVNASAQALDWIKAYKEEGLELDWQSHLHNACLKGNVEIIKALLRAGANATESEGELDTVTRPRDLGKDPQRFGFGFTRSDLSYYPADPLWVAFDQGHVEACILLTAAGADPKKIHWHPRGQDLRFIWASSKRLNGSGIKSQQTLDWLLEQGCDFAQCSRSEKIQPLLWALMEECIDQAERLALAGLHHPQSKAQSPLPLAVIKNESLCSFLLDMGEDPNKRGLTSGQKAFGGLIRPNNRLCLIEALRYKRSIELIQKLLDAGANTLLLDGEDSAVSVAEERHRDDVLSLFEHRDLDRLSGQCVVTSKKKAKKAQKKAKKAELLNPNSGEVEEPQSIAIIEPKLRRPRL